MRRRPPARWALHRANPWPLCHTIKGEIPMPKPQFHFKSQGNFIDGQFTQPQDPSGEWTSKSPGDFSDEIGRFHYSYSSVEHATRSAREAFPTWRKVPL